MSNSPDPTKRFSSRVADYVKFRPSYPPQVIDLLRQTIALASDWIVADIGCGTGISSRLFLEHGHTVLGIEPNPDMLAAAEADLADQPRFRPIPESAEKTGLADQSADLIVAAQAFHKSDAPFPVASASSPFEPQARRDDEQYLNDTVRRSNDA